MLEDDTSICQDCSFGKTNAQYLGLIQVVDYTGDQIHCYNKWHIGQRYNFAIKNEKDTQ